MPQKVLMIVTVVSLLGAGCLPTAAIPKGDHKPTTTFVASPEPGHESICMTFQHQDGFELWLDGYEKSNVNAILLATNIKLPEEADPILIKDIRDSLTSEFYHLNYLCVLDDKIKIITWMVDDLNPEYAECQGVQFTRVEGVMSIADFNSPGRGANCQKLCEPKIHSNETLVWQCDLRERIETASWTELRQDRTTGLSTPNGCKETSEGVTPGCVR